MSSSRNVGKQAGVVPRFPISMLMAKPLSQGRFKRWGAGQVVFHVRTVIMVTVAT